MKFNKKHLKYVYIGVVAVISAIVFLIQSYQTSRFISSESYSSADIVLHIIDVGQGDAIFIDNGDEDILVDAGTGESAPRVLEYLDSFGTTNIKYAFFTHPHEDHIGGGDDVITHFNVENVVMPDYSEDTKCYKDLMSSIKSRGVNLEYAVSGDEYRVGDIKIDVLSPGKGYETDDANKVSLIMRVSYGDIDMMLTGDAEKTNESYVIRRYPEKLDCEILKVGHHGSSSSSSEKFLEEVTPEVALISLGEGNSYGHPHKETISRLNKHTDEVHQTAEEGDLVLGITRENFWFVEE